MTGVSYGRLGHCQRGLATQTADSPEYSPAGSAVDAARRFADAGIAAIPLRPGTKWPAVRFASILDGRRRADPTRMPWEAGSGVAVLMGGCSGGLAARDFDRRECYEAWASDHPSLARELPTTITPRGAHVLFRMAGGSPAGHVTVTQLPDGAGELRVSRGYVVAPPSVHPSGVTYEWRRSPFDLPGGAERIPELCPVEAGLIGAEHLPLSAELTGPGSRRGFTASQDAPHAVRASVVPAAAFWRLKLADLSESVQRALRPHVVQAAGERHRRLFDFARSLQGLPECRDRESRRPVRAEYAAAAFGVWYRLSRKRMRTQDVVTNWNEFVDAWGRVRMPAGAGLEALADDAITRAMTGPPPGLPASSRRRPAMELVTWFCVVAAEMRGGAPFVVAQERVADALGLQRPALSKHLAELQRCRLLRMVRPADRRGLRAATFQWLGELPALSGLSVERN